MTKTQAPEKTSETLPAKRQATEITSQISDDFFAERAGEGLENVTANDVLIPRLTIIQALSPQRNSRKPEYIPEAEEGDIVDVGTGDLFKEGILFLPCYFTKNYLEWAPRNTGKGLVNIHTDAAILNQTVKNEKNQPILPNGNLIAETAQIYGMNLTANRRFSFIPFTSSQLKKSKKWMTLAMSEKLRRKDGSEFVPALYFRAYDLTTAEENNNDGDWYGWVINRGPSLPELNSVLDLGVDWRVIAEEAEAFRDSIIRGDTRADVQYEDAAQTIEQGAM